MKNKTQHIMEKNHYIILSLIIIFLLVPFCVPAGSAACITYSSSSRTITVSCTILTHLNDVNTAINNDNILQKQSGGIWTLAANLVISKGANLVIDSTDGTWLKIVSDGTVAFGIKNSGELKIDTFKVTSWNTATNTYASAGTDGSTPRAHIVSLSGGTGKTNILNSEIAYLGYSKSGGHGLDYYGGGGTPGSLIQNNHIHHLWRAFYSSGVGGITFTKNVVHDSIEYGIDPHSGTHDTYITYNKVYNNNHGIICSVMCDKMHITNNELYNNKRDGIFMDAGSHHSWIANNIIHDEEVAIQLPSLSYSSVYGNTITNSKYGMKIYTQTPDDRCGDIGCVSVSNQVHDNHIRASNIAIEVKGGASSNTFTHNTIDGINGDRGIVVDGSKTSNNVFNDNHISNAKYAIRLTGGNVDSKFSNNHMDTVFGSGEYTLAGASSVNIDTTQFSSDVIRSLDSSSNKAAISSSGTISVADGSTGQITQYNTNTQPFTKTLGSNAKVTVTSASISGDTTPPTVMGNTSPASGATGVAVASSLTATFSEPVQAPTVASSFTLKTGTTAVSGQVTLNGNTATFDPPSSLAASTSYTATITTGVKDLAGNAMTSAKTWSFTTAAQSDTTPPTVTSTTPAGGATGVAATSVIKATFSEKVMGTTVTSSTFILKNSAGASITGQVSSDGITATFTPSSQLAFSTSYTATLSPSSTNSVKDLAGNAMAPKSWSFTTAAAPTQTTSCGSNLPVSATSSGSQNSFPPTNAIDNNLNTKWYSTYMVNPWIKVDLGAQKSVCGVDIAWADGASRQYSFIIAISTDGTSFTDVFSGKSKGTSTSPEKYNFAESQARYVRTTITQSHTGSASSIAQISELDIYGQASSASSQFSSSSTSPLATIKETTSTPSKNNTMTPRTSESDSQIRLPVAKHDKYSTEANKPILATILENDLDPDGNGINLLSVSSPTKEGGHVTMNKNGTVTFTPLQGFIGKDSFSYMILDEKGKTDQARVDITIKGTPNTEQNLVPQPPIEEGTSNMDSGQEQTQIPTDQKKQTTNAFKESDNKLPPFPKSNLVISNTPPKANAGENKIVKEGLRATLDGSKSQDRDAKIVSYVWRQLSGPPVLLEHVKEIRSDFVAPPVEQDVSLVFRLTVTDENGNSNSDMTRVKIINDSPTSSNSNNKESLFDNPNSQNNTLR
jgi:hypothetical protein